eukprot:4600295-Amphidinium_carterae.4
MAEHTLFRQSFSYEIGRRKTSAEGANVASKANAGSLRVQALQRTQSALDPSHTRIAGECRWADEAEAMSKARALVPRTSRTRASGLRAPRRHPTTKNELQTEATSSKEHATCT